ncbi:hypothetical protein ASD81_21540 [Nocardioides sp. Root614]|nr:hypothetical protein ASD81_21540 [Nocardioides sp. Root614]KRA88267.1 hypothetical protein ASD84_20075 [Nocardioides sp. Root682]
MRPDGLQVAEDAAGGDHVADRDRRRHRFVRRPGVAVADDDHPAARDPPGERDPSGERRADWLPDPAAEVDAPVPGTPWISRWIEARHHLRGGVQRPHPDRIVVRPGGPGTAHEGNEGRQDEHLDAD